MSFPYAVSITAAARRRERQTGAPLPARNRDENVHVVQRVRVLVTANAVYQGETCAVESDRDGGTPCLAMESNRNGGVPCLVMGTTLSCDVQQRRKS